MSCPICGELCRCAEPRSFGTPAITFADVDAYEPTEEQFTASLLSTARSHVQTQELISGTPQSARERYGSFQPQMPSSDSLSSPDNENAWRDEVSSRIQDYKARRRSSLGDASLSFNFESTTANHVFLRPEHDPEPLIAAIPSESESYPYYPNASATAPALESTLEPTSDIDQPTSEVQPEFADLFTPVPHPAQSPKLILFPKPYVEPEVAADLLAEPMIETPRILDAPEDTEQIAIPLHDISLHPEDGETPVPYIDEDAHELPVVVAPVSQRIVAELIDGILVVFASFIFATIADHTGATALSADKHTLAMMVMLVPATFWILYKFMFLVYGGATIGMLMTNLQLLDFDGVMPNRTARRYRALSMLISTLPLGLGLLWSFVDPDTLCWHDRISRTYTTSQ
jgi:hypothetical protein